MSWTARFAREAGVATVWHAGRDAKLLCAQRFVRLFAYGASFLVLVPFLSSLGIPDARIGLFMTCTLLGDVVISLVLTAITDRIGRRRILAVGAVLMAGSGAVFATTRHSFAVLLVASIVGVISPSGNEIGPFRAVEESVLAQLTPAAQRTDMFAWYTLFGTAGTALGSLAGGAIVQLFQNRLGEKGHDMAYRAIFFMYASIGIIKLFLTLALSPAVEAAHPVRAARASPAPAGENAPLLADAADATSTPPSKTTATATTVLGYVRSLVPHISPASRGILYGLVLLFALDSFASGMAAPSWITYFFTTVHTLAPAILGTLFLVTNILASVSNLLALPLARRLGPLRTMAFTHLPSAVFLALVPVPPPSSSDAPFGTPMAMAFLALRACTQSMDQAPRQAFLSAAVLPAERTAVMGVVNTAKTLMQAAGVGASGVLAGRHQWVLLLGGAGALKALYDLLLLWNFSHLRHRQDEEHEWPARDASRA